MISNRSWIKATFSLCGDTEGELNRIMSARRFIQIRICISFSILKIESISISTWNILFEPRYQLPDVNWHSSLRLPAHDELFERRHSPFGCLPRCSIIGIANWHTDMHDVTWRRTIRLITGVIGVGLTSFSVDFELSSAWRQSKHLKFVLQK